MAVELPHSLEKSFSTTSLSSEHTRAFRYDVLEDKHIRLFKLDLNGEDEPLSGQLLTTFFQWDSIDIFRASYYKEDSEFHKEAEDADVILDKLSGAKVFHKVTYRWGSQAETTPLRLSVIHSRLGQKKTVQVNSEPYRNGVIQIGANLRDLLLELRRRKHNHFLWIDSICINQQNEDEFRAQRPLMRLIYASDGDVIVWLGAASPHTSMAVAMLPNLTNRLEEVVKAKIALNPARPETFEAANLPEPDAPLWKQIANLFKHDYFNRLWTLQEVVVAQNALSSDWKTTLLTDLPVWIGGATVPLPLFGRFDEAARDLGLRNWLISGKPYAITRSLHAFDGLKEIRLCRSSLHANAWGLSPSALLLGTRRRKATVPADMVFGMFALMDNETKKRLTPKGAFQPEDIYVDFGKWYIVNEHKENLLNHTETVERNGKLPSWCPNFASPPATLSLGSRSYVDWFLRGQWMDNTFHAGYQRKGKWALPTAKLAPLRAVGHFMTGKALSAGVHDVGHKRQISLIDGSSSLLIKGLHIDFVTASVPPNAASESSDFLNPMCSRATVVWIEQCMALASRVRPQVDGFLNDFVRTLVTCRVVAQLSFLHDSDMQQMLLDSAGNVDLLGRYQKWRHYADSVKDAPEASLTPDNLDAETLQFAEVLARITARRRFFITEEGRMGLGPADLENEDSVCIFFFCPTPYIIRSNENGRHRLIGEAYVHGVMYGEALDMFDNRSLQETKWVIE